jgi:hypothetical protein
MSGVCTHNQQISTCSGTYNHTLSDSLFLIGSALASGIGVSWSGIVRIFAPFFHFCAICPLFCLAVDLS